MTGRGAGPFLLALAPFLCPALAGCETRVVPADAGLSEPSPNASILPAPLAPAPEAARVAGEAARPAVDAGPTDAGADVEVAPPTVTREDEAPAVDADELHDTTGLTLRARFRWPDITLPGRLPEMNVEALDRARAASTFDLDITSAAVGRLRIGLAAARFVLAAGSEFRARSQSYGHVLLWPDRSRYVVVQPGALRTVLNERRADTVPLTHTAGVLRGGAQALGYPSERTRLTTPLGKLELEQARVAGAGAGGALLCRFLVELAGVHPDSAACVAEHVPVRAEYSWLEGGALVFEVLSLERTSVDLAFLRAPPEGALHRIGELPAPSSALLVERAQLRSIRLRPAPARTAKDAPKDGLLLVNADDLLRYALLDGLPVVRLEAHGSGFLLDVVAGTYSVAVRTFLGDELSHPTLAVAPGRHTTAESPQKEPASAEPGETAPGTRAPRAAPSGSRRLD